MPHTDSASHRLHAGAQPAEAGTFATLKLHASLQQAIADLGYRRPTPIQALAIPPALEGRDLLATAMTGSGKTAGFLLPLLQHLIGKPRGVTRLLILTPTRELAAQVMEDFTDLAVHTPLTGAAIFGGVGMGPQEQALRRGVDVIVATPGRLLDHLRAPYAKLSSLEYLVLDEADRMLDMGFLPDIRRILKVIPTRRQTLFFSATMPPPIATLTRDLLKNPVVIDAGGPATPATGITQAIYPVPQELKAGLLVRLLSASDIQDALVFTRTKHRADRLTRYLSEHGISVARIHGNRSQAQRTEALAGFKSGRYRVLVATDIAARGIDISALGHVVNFDTPAAAEDYIHRVGRTARAEATGTAFTFVSPEEDDNLQTIERAIGRRLPRVTVPDFDYTARRTAPPLEVPLRDRIAAIQAQRRKGRPHPQGAQGPGHGDGRRRGGAGRSAHPAGPSRPQGHRRTR